MFAGTHVTICDKAGAMKPFHALMLLWVLLLLTLAARMRSAGHWHCRCTQEGGCRSGAGGRSLRTAPATDGRLPGFGYAFRRSPLFNGLVIACTNSTHIILMG